MFRPCASLRWAVAQSRLTYLSKSAEAFPPMLNNSLVFSTDGTYADANSLMYHQISTGDGWQAASNAGTNARKLTVSCWFKRTLLILKL